MLENCVVSFMLLSIKDFDGYNFIAINFIVLIAALFHVRNAIQPKNEGGFTRTSYNFATEFSYLFGITTFENS
jgi:hypothetical protein